MRYLIAFLSAVFVYCGIIGWGMMEFAESVDGEWGFLLGFLICGCASVAALFLAVFICGQNSLTKNRIIGVLLVLVQCGGSVCFCTFLEFEFSFFGGYLSSSLFISVVFVFAMLKFLGQSDEESQESKNLTRKAAWTYRKVNDSNEKIDCENKKKFFTKTPENRAQKQKNQALSPYIMTISNVCKSGKNVLARGISKRSVSENLWVKIECRDDVVVVAKVCSVEENFRKVAKSSENAEIVIELSDVNYDFLHPGDKVFVR